MKLYTLHREQKFDLSRERLFDFFAKPENLEKITPSSVGFTILTPPPIVMQAGLVLDYTIKLFGLSVHWTTLISSYDPPERFSDVALKGPYAFWHHTHSFVANDDGTTTIHDDIRYAIKFGIFGRIAHSLWVKGELKKIFDYREKIMAKLLPTL